MRIVIPCGIMGFKKNARLYTSKSVCTASSTHHHHHPTNNMTRPRQPKHAKTRTAKAKACELVAYEYLKGCSSEFTRDARELEKRIHATPQDQRGMKLTTKLTTIEQKSTKITIRVGTLMCHGYIKHRGELKWTLEEYIRIVLRVIDVGVFQKAENRNGKKRWQIVDQDLPKLKLFLAKVRGEENAYSICTCFVKG